MPTPPALNVTVPGRNKYVLITTRSDLCAPRYEEPRKRVLIIIQVFGSDLSDDGQVLGPEAVRL